MKRVFVSHTNYDAASDHFVQSLCTSLQKHGHDVLIDRQRLLPGAAWRREIYTWLSVCHAAIVVLSPKALREDSIWVPREAALLMWRRALDPKLCIIPVLTGGVTLDDVENNRFFRDLQIRELQVVDLSVLTEATTSIISSLGQSGPEKSTPFEELVDIIAPLFSRIDDEHLDQAAALVRMELNGIDISDLRRQLAFKLLSADLDAFLPAFDYLFARARSSARADLADILEILGANWVDPEAAQWIAREAALRLAGRKARPLLLNATTLFAAQMYIQRASWRPPHARWPMIPVTGVTGTETTAELVDEIDYALEAALPLQPDPFQPDGRARRERQLKQMQRLGVPLFVVMRPPQITADLLLALETSITGANVIFLSGDGKPDELLFPEDRFRLIQPLLAEGAESSAQAALDSYRAAYRIPERR